MALRNAFANLLTETVTGAVEAAIERIDKRQARQSLMEQPRSLQYARNKDDCMKIELTNAQQVIPYVGNSSLSLNAAALVRVHGDSNAIFMVDERWQQSEQSMQTFNQVRTNRWVFS